MPWQLIRIDINNIVMFFLTKYEELALNVIMLNNETFPPQADIT